MNTTPTAILHAQIPRGTNRCRSKPVTVSPILQKTLLLAIAAHEGERATVAQLASLMAVSEQWAQHAMVVLMERGLVERRSVAPETPGMAPASKRTQHYAYFLRWSAINRLPRIEVPTSSDSLRRRKAARAAS